MTAHLTNTLARWWESRREQLSAAELQVQLHVEDHASSGYIDVDGPAFFAQATVWNEGFCDREAIDANTGEQLFWEHEDEVTDDRLVQLLDAFAGRLLRFQAESTTGIEDQEER